jgi:hypothetical protein
VPEQRKWKKQIKRKRKEEEEKTRLHQPTCQPNLWIKTTATTAHFFLWARSRREAQGGFGRVGRSLSVAPISLPHSPPCAPHPPPSRRRSSLSLSPPFLPLSVPVDSAAAVVPLWRRFGRDEDPTGVCLPIPLPSHPAAVVVVGCVCIRIWSWFY